MTYDITTYSRCFLCYLPSSLFATKGGNTKSAYIKSAKSFYTASAYVSNIFTRGTCAGNVFSAISAYIKDVSPDGTGTEDAGRESACTEGTCTIKHLRIHLYSFSISEIELFDIGYWLLIDVLFSRYGYSNILFKLRTGIRAV